MNFWQASGGKTSRALAPSELFLFKLHSPNDYIGGGVFSHASNVPLSMAWDCFVSQCCPLSTFYIST